MPGSPWGRLRLVVQAGISAHLSGNQDCPVGPSRRARRRGRLGRKGVSDGNYPLRFAYAQVSPQAGGVQGESIARSGIWLFACRRRIFIGHFFERPW